MSSTIHRLLPAVLGFLLLASCIDRIRIEIPDSELQLVVDGVITDEPGPYTVQLTRASRVDDFLNFRKFVTAKSVTIYDNIGNTELLNETQMGVYQTKANGIQGVVGREYWIKIEMLDGRVYESIPDRMNPVGRLDSLYYEVETFQPISDPTQYGLRIYVDGKGIPEEDNLLRWKFQGTYVIDAYPLIHTSAPFCTPDPRPCGSDFPCTCCRCWVTRNEDQPHVSDNQFVSNGLFKRAEIVYIPIEYFPFQIKYRISVKQMSLSRRAFDYWRIIQRQKEGATSLFQPPTGIARTNIVEKSGLGTTLGIFYAAAVKKKEVYITRADVTRQLQSITIPNWNCEVGIIAEDCRLAFPLSTTTRPADWKD